MPARTRSAPTRSILPFGRRLALLTLTLLLAASCTSQGKPVEETVPSVTLALYTSGRLEMSRLAYKDACGNQQAFAVGPALAEAFSHTAGRGFAVVKRSEGAEQPAADRVIEVDLALGELVLFVAKDTPGAYPVSVSLSVSLAAYDPAGRLLEEQQLGTEVSGTVHALAGRCAVKGLEQVAENAVRTVAEDFGRYLRSSQAVATGTASPGVARGMAPALAFRARLSDHNGDRVVESEEEITLEMEVTNVGRIVVRDVHALVTGSLELLPPLPPRILLGDLQPGESRRHRVTARLVPVAQAGQVELIVSLASRSAAVQPSTRKKFVVTVRPKRTARLRGPVGAPPPRSPAGTAPGAASRAPNRIDSVKPA